MKNFKLCWGISMWSALALLFLSWITRDSYVSLSRFFRAVCFLPSTIISIVDAVDYGRTPKNKRKKWEFTFSRSLSNAHPYARMAFCCALELIIIVITINQAQMGIGTW